MTPALIFDLDGTLVDTAPDLLAALNHALKGEGLAPVNPDNLRQLVGRGARVMIAEAFKMAIGPVEPDQAERMLQAFLAYYRDHVADKSLPYPGVEETLDQLRTEGARMGVLTNKPHELSLLLLHKLGLDTYFVTIFGQGRADYMKPDPRIFEDTVREVGGKGSGAVMIGDSSTDVETARAAAAPVILVSFGYTQVPARELGADAVVDHFAEIPAAIRQVLGR
jgi:phosphoglycolate phosphatase